MRSQLNIFIYFLLVVLGLNCCFGLKSVNHLYIIFKTLHVSLLPVLGRPAGGHRSPKALHVQASSAALGRLRAGSSPGALERLWSPVPWEAVCPYICHAPACRLSLAGASLLPKHVYQPRSLDFSRLCLKNDVTSIQDISLKLAGINLGQSDKKIKIRQPSRDG